MKICKKCNQEKELEQFSKNSTKEDKLEIYCKECKSQICKKYYSKNKSKIKEKSSLYIKNNKEEHNTLMKKWYQNNKEEHKQKSNKYYQDNKEKHKINSYIWRDNNKVVFQEYQKEYRLKNNTKLKIQIRDWNLNEYKNNLNYKIKRILRSRIHDIIKYNRSKSKLSLILLGCGIEKFKQHLEQQFKPEMNWENHGKIWEIDHIIGCCNFDLTKEEEQQKCFHYTNLQPLFKTTEIAESFGYANEIGNKNKIKYNER